MRAGLYARLLAAYPLEFRQRHGASMRRDYADAVRDAGRRGRIAALVTASAWQFDAVRHGIAERLAVFRTRRAERMAARRTGVFGKGPWHDGVTFDLRIALRRLRREPGFATFVVLTLALGIGGTASVFAFYSVAFLRPLPWREGDRLVRIEMVDERGRGRARVSIPDATDFAAASGVAQVAVVDYGTFALAGGADEPVVVRGASASPSLFDVLGVNAARGRLFTPEDVARGSAGVAVLSDGLWRRRFGGDASVVGRTVVVQDRPHIVIGVLSPDFVAPDAALEGAPELWVPLSDTGPLAGRGVRWLQGIARLRPGVTTTAATTSLAAIAKRLADAFPETNTGVSARVIPLRDAMWGDARAPMLLLLCAAGAVLLIACANLANLLMARASSRSREMAVRAALGAGRLRIVRQLVVEQSVLALLGAIAGTALALIVRSLARAAAADRLPLLMAAPLDARVLGLTFALAATAALLFGLLPGISCTSAAATLHEGRGNTQGRTGLRARRFLVGAQVTLCFVLLVGASLLLRGFQRLTRIDPGFDAARVMSFELTLPASRYADPDAVIAFQTELLDRLAALPGVEAAGLVDKLPLGTRWGCDGLLVEGQPAPQDPALAPCGDLRSVSSDYLQAMGISIASGRGFAAARSVSATEVLVNRTLAAQLWPDADAVGRRIAWAHEGTWRTVTGIVEDVRHRGSMAPAFPEVYMPFESAPDARSAFVVRTEADPLALAPLVRQTLAELDGQLPVRNLQALRTALSASLAAPRTGMIAMAALSAIALFLASVGLYGVLAWFVARRAPEIGIRMALGAERGDVIRLVLGEGLKTVAVATLIGAVIAVVVARIARSLLFGADPADPVAYSAVTLLVLSIAALACWLPARQALRVGVSEAIRRE